MSAAADVEREVLALADPERAEPLARYLQVRPGGYGEGDQVLGVRVPEVRRVVRAHRAAAGPDDVDALLGSPWHEVRLAGCVLATELARRPAARTGLVRLLLRRTERLNGWDLVDTVAPHVLGAWLRDHDRAVIDELAASPLVWDRRLAVVATLALVRDGDHADALRLAGRLLDDPHELIHKAVGWVLRETGQRDRPALDAFLAAHVARMPRVTLRYALEKHPADERARWMRA